MNLYQRNQSHLWQRMLRHIYSLPENLLFVSNYLCLDRTHKSRYIEIYHCHLNQGMLCCRLNMLLLIFAHFLGNLLFYSTFLYSGYIPTIDWSSRHLEYALTQRIFFSPILNEIEVYLPYLGMGWCDSHSSWAKEVVEKSSNKSLFVNVFTKQNADIENKTSGWNWLRLQ